MGHKTLHVFNPEHDLALAVGGGPYTPPAEILKIKKENALLPAYYADNGDFILIPKEISHSEIFSSELYKKVREKNLSILTPDNVCSVVSRIKNVLPWGWDHAVARFLADSGIDSSLIPSTSILEIIRKISHRRTIIPFRETMSQKLGIQEKFSPIEIFSVDELRLFLKDWPKTFFKAPWSSSGRGIVVSDHITEKGLLEWAHGIIRKQGSLIAEPAWQRSLDFATEWIIKKGEPEFIGFSVFQTSSRGKYHGNIKASQDELRDMILQKAPSFSNDMLEAQKLALKTHIAPSYSGPLGIDMLADIQGHINPCVEINLRLTMGLIEIIKDKPKVLTDLWLH